MARLSYGRSKEGARWLVPMVLKRCKGWAKPLPYPTQISHCVMGTLHSTSSH